MDVTTIGGFLLAIVMIFMAISGGLTNFIDTPSLLIVIGGGLAATAMSIPLMTLKRVGGILGAAFRERNTNAKVLIQTMVKFSEIARRDGILALEGALDEIEDEFLKNGIQMAIDGTDPDVISDTLSSDLEQMQNRHANCKAVFELLGKYAPAYGMIGTLVGLILMLAELDDPASIAPNMAVALVTTFYGALVANVFALPLADKLDKKNQQESISKEIVISGVMGIQSGDSPRVLEQKLSIFLPPDLRSAE